ncbi:hypothetical protein GGTG_04538 [Gaeumannomyces tritici R3-111a-1]|uniref:Uncharacterized protein n=1 Tax=Gaeumannomyces tritici (strain R3-111a-1) TaxID=644352 RepID=J3NTD9_GAET3|nr:hypothetical protein GGTG_04538 [Gaeumannomyces tritici R3-111a-1]EJT79454.1 hypothetical protein GGTG_04538 [Gaeumannomyces tritici R3-111a-1]
MTRQRLEPQCRRRPGSCPRPGRFASTPSSKARQHASEALRVEEEVWAQVAAGTNSQPAVRAISIYDLDDVGRALARMKDLERSTTTGQVDAPGLLKRGGLRRRRGTPKLTLSL